MRRHNLPDVGIVQNQDESAAINQSLDLISANKLIKESDVVVITPNWVQQQPPSTGVVSGTESLRTIIRFVKACNPRRIVVATGSGQKSTSEIMTSIGFDKIIKEENVEFVDLNHGPFVKVRLDHDFPFSTSLNKLYDEMTFLISFTQLKYHSEATISACIKNIALGWPPAKEHGHPKKSLGIHNNLHGFIRAMAEILPIDLSILSANPAMIGTGPADGVPMHTGIVLSSTDPVAIDTLGARLLGFKPQAVRYLYECIMQSIGIGDPNLMNIKGLSLTEVEKCFSMSVYNKEIVLDKQ